MAGFLLFPVAIAVGLLAGYFGGEQRGWVAGFLVGAIIALIRVSWPLQKTTWFWMAVAAFSVVDVLMLSLVDWSFTAHWNGHLMSGLAVSDLAVMMTIVYGLYRLNYGTPAALFEEDSGDLPDYAKRNIEL